MVLSRAYIRPRLRRRAAGTGTSDTLLQFLPIGLTLHSDESFTTPWSGTSVFNNWQVSQIATFDKGGNTVTSPVWREDATGGYGPAVARVECPEGSLGGIDFPLSGGTGFGTFNTTDNVATNYRRMYFAIRVKFSSGYLIHNNDEKFVYPTYYGTSPNQVPLTGLYPADGSLTGAGPARITAIYWGENPFNAPVSAPVVPMGEWVTICYDMLLNTPESANGHLKVWVNGVQALNKTNWLAFTGTNQLTFKSMRLTSVRGGGPAAYPVPAGGQWRDYDRMVLYYGAT